MLLLFPLHIRYGTKNICKRNKEEKHMNTADYENFKTNLLGYVETIAKEYDLEIVHTRINKVNKHNLEAITLKSKTETSFIAPTFYPKEMYEHYLRGESIEDQIGAIKNMFQKGEANKIDLKLSPEFIKDNVYPQLIGINGNRAFLHDVPHKIIAKDLAMIMRVDAGNDRSFIVKESLLQHLQLGKNEIMETALNNLEKATYDLQPLDNYLFGISTSMSDSTNGTKIVVLTNQSKVNGAAEILNRKAMDEAASLMQTKDILIIPSSLHETLLVSFSSSEEAIKAKNQLKEMVRSVNNTVVDPSEVLSYSVYYYDSVKHEIGNADDLRIPLEDSDHPHISHRM